jgi:hypothetical protein
MQVRMAVEMERSLERKRLRSARRGAAAAAGASPMHRSARNLDAVADQASV